VKLIYCAGLRLSECLSLTVNDILGDERKLMVREGKGNKDRMVPLAQERCPNLSGRNWPTNCKSISAPSAIQPARQGRLKKP